MHGELARAHGAQCRAPMRGHAGGGFEACHGPQFLTDDLILTIPNTKAMTGDVVAVLEGCVSDDTWGLSVDCTVLHATRTGW